MASLDEVIREVENGFVGSPGDEDWEAILPWGRYVAGLVIRLRYLAKPFLSPDSFARLADLESALDPGDLTSTTMVLFELQALVSIIENARNENVAANVSIPASQPKNNNPKLGRPTDKVEVNPTSDRVFVAMWYHESTEDAWEKGIKPAIEESGYEPVLVKDQQFVGLIVNKIISEIRRARFVVVDYTHGTPGARGSVYYEAGYADGMGLEVISTCKKTILRKVHFDTQQHNHIVWETGREDELKTKLKNRITELVGDGPLNKSANVEPAAIDGRATSLLS